MDDGAQDSGGDSGRRGNIGNEIFDQVEKLMADEGLSRTNAFARLSEMTGRRAGTVAANYYRVARQRGAELQPRAPRGSKQQRRGPGRPPSTATPGVDAAVAKANDALQDLAAIVKSQERELVTLRSQAEQVEKLKGLLNRM